MAIPGENTTVMNKQAKDIQSNIQLIGDKITGTSKYVQGITDAGGDGNYLVLEFPQAKVEENKVTCSYEDGKATTLSTSDYQYLIKLKEKKPITVTVTGKVSATRTLNISELELQSQSEAIKTKQKITKK